MKNTKDMPEFYSSICFFMTCKPKFNEVFFTYGEVSFQIGD